MDLLDSVRRTIRRHALAGPDTRVLAAVSGGSDSVALACLLDVLDRTGELRLVGLAHFNHQLRNAAAADEQYCALLAASLARPFVADRADVGALARRDGLSLENAARTARHGFLERARVDLAADVVALGHTKDDQAETFLLRLLRGAGPRGLASMHPRHGAVVRPLLECRRAQLRSYLATRGVPFVHDESNDDVGIPRNRVRAELLPLLEERFNPSIVEVLAGEAELARDDHACLAALAEDWWPRVVLVSGRRWRLDADTLRGVPRAVARVLVRRAMVNAAHGRDVTFNDVERALELCSAPGPPFDGPGQRVERIGPDVVLTGRPSGSKGRPVAAPLVFSYALSVPGEVVLAESRCTISAAVAPGTVSNPVSGCAGDRPRGSVGAVDSTAAAGATALVRLDACGETLAVRNRRPGDRFRPAGFSGRRKLQDFFVDRKVARIERDFVPIVVDRSDRIVWVAGHAIAEEFRVTDSTQAVLVLRLNGVGGST